MAEHDRIKARNRTLAAEKESLAQDLFDTRTANETLKSRVGVMERELGTKGELVTNLRSENEVLDEMRRLALTELERMGRQNFGDITIVGPKLPEPLHNALKAFADQHPSLVTYDAARGIVKWKADLLFPLGSDVVKEESLQPLREFTQVLSSPAASDFEVAVVGHTDNRPISRAETKQKHPTNWHLSAHRAISVGGALQKFNYSPDRIGVMGYGEYRPVASNGSDQGQSQNRRVDVYIIPKGILAESSASAKPTAKESVPAVRLAMPERG